MPRTTKQNVTEDINDMEMNTTTEVTELKAEIERLKSLLNSSTESEEDNNIPDEPSASKQIKIVSLCYGALNLSTEPFGKGRLTSFTKFGDIKTVLYGTLVDIVNNHRTFSEQGKFYILNPDAVYHLGLSEFYNNILSKEMIDGIFNYDETRIRNLIMNSPLSQREVLARNIIDRLVSGEALDLNKCSIVAKYSGIDITSKVDDLKAIAELMNDK